MSRGKIKIEGDATGFINAGKEVESSMESMSNTASESFITTMNSATSLFNTVLGYAKEIINFTKKQMELAAEVERGDIAWKMLKRQNAELHEAAQNSMEYSLGMLKVRDSVFVINNLLQKGINLSAQEYQNLVQTASVMSIKLGVPIEGLIEQIARIGLGSRGSAEQLKQMGIELDTVAVLESYAGGVGKIVENLTQAETRSVIFNAVLEKMNETLSMDFEEVDHLAVFTKSLEYAKDEVINFDEQVAKSISNVGAKVINYFKDTSIAQKNSIKISNEVAEAYGYADFKTAQWLLDNTSAHAILEEGQKSYNDRMVEMIEMNDKIELQEENSRHRLKQKIEAQELNIILKDLKAEYDNGSITLQEYESRIERVENAFRLWGSYVRRDFIQDVNTGLRGVATGLSALEGDDTFLSNFEKRLESTSKKREENRKKWARIREQNEQKEQQRWIDGMVFADEDISKYYDKIHQERILSIDVENRIKEMQQENHLQKMQQNRLMSDATELSDLDNLYKNEIDRFLLYAQEKMLNEEILQSGLLNIKNRYTDLKEKLDVKEYTTTQRYKDMASDYVKNQTTALMEALISSQDDALQYFISNALKQAGSTIWAEGLTAVWQGTLGLIAGNPLAATQIALGGAAMVVGAGLGYAGNQLAPSSSTDNARFDNESNKTSKRGEEVVRVYQYPSEAKYLQNLKQQMKNI